MDCLRVATTVKNIREVADTGKPGAVLGPYAECRFRLADEAGQIKPRINRFEARGSATRDTWLERTTRARSSRRRWLTSCRIR